MSGPLDDRRLVAHVRGQIVNYRLGSQPLEATCDAMRLAFDIGLARLRAMLLEEALCFLEAVVASGGDHSTAVDKALDEIDAALQRVLEQHAA